MAELVAVLVAELVAELVAVLVSELTFVVPPAYATFATATEFTTVVKELIVPAA